MTTKPIPKQIRKTDIPQDRRAIAPYNFVELPEMIVPAQELPDFDRYYPDRHTGRIECTLTTESPLYIRCGKTPEQFKEGIESKELPEFFYLDDQQKPVIPGSSLRGMLRTLIEIASFSKVDRVSDAQKFFFRAVAGEKDDPLQKPYKELLKNVRAGYLERANNQWSIRPALPIEDNYFVWVEEEKATKAISELIAMSNKDYKPQYIENISFEDIVLKNGRKFVKNISRNHQRYQYKGVLVTSGNMLESASSETKSQPKKKTEKKGTERKYHCIIRERDSNADLIPIDNQAIEDYCSALTPFQKKEPFDEENGILKEGRVIFYIPPDRKTREKSITLFGHSPNFRIPYRIKDKITASSAIDFVPDSLKDNKDSKDSYQIDIADAIFGWVRSKKQSENQSQIGRVSISDAIYQKSKTNEIWYESNPITPQILASPKPTTFQHYLVQTSHEQKNLKHYASTPCEETIIRGHKLYWHKGLNPEIKHPDPTKTSDTQTTQIKPIKTGVTFTFTIDFENLTDVELGALLWVLDKGQRKYRLKLGMGKPLGMGAVKIESQLYLSQRKDRYQTLFAQDNWCLADNLDPDPDYSGYFENYILERLKQPGKFADIERIKMLLEMLKWHDNPSDNYLKQRRYMMIEPTNEYKDRPILPILPTPLEVDQQPQQLQKPQQLQTPKKECESSFSEGQKVSVKVEKIEKKTIQKGNKTQLRTIITYKIEDLESHYPTEEVNKKEVSLQIGDTVEVTVEKISNGIVKRVQRVINETNNLENHESNSH